jgi:dGTPase
VLESQAYHSRFRHAPDIRELVGSGQPLLEAQVVDVTDSLAYNTHDVDDALSVGLVTLEDLQGVEFWRRATERTRRRHGQIGPHQFQPTVVRALIDWQVADLLEQTRAQLEKQRIRTVEDVRASGRLLVEPGPEVTTLKAALEKFLHERVYAHYRVQRMAAKGRRFLQALFEEFCGKPRLLPERYAERAKMEPVERTVCDYIAGMTDRYAQDEFQRLFQPYHGV